MSEPAAVPKPKRIRTLPPLEGIPDEIVCTNLPDADKVPRILLSQIDNTEGLKRAIRYGLNGFTNNFFLTNIKFQYPWRNNCN